MHTDITRGCCAFLCNNKAVPSVLCCDSLTCNDVLASLLNGTLNHRVRLGQPLEALNKLGQVRGNLGLNSYTHLQDSTAVKAKQHILW